MEKSQSLTSSTLASSMTRQQQIEKKRYLKRLQALYDCKKFLSSWPGFNNHYQIISKIGEGTFSTVYKAEDLRRHVRPQFIETTSPYVALKYIFSTSSETRILNEVKILADLRGHNNVASLVTLHRHDDKIVVVMPYCEHIDVKVYFHSLSIAELRYYFLSLFSALQFCHSKNIIHRDVKPGNFLYHPTKRHGVLVDFGLAQKLPQERTKPERFSQVPTKRNQSFLDAEMLLQYTPNVIPEFSNSITRPSLLVNDTRPSVNASRGGTRGFRAPEVLIKVPNQTSAIDIWSAGVTLLCFLTRKFPFFESPDDMEALQEIAILFGSRQLRRFASQHQRILLCKLPNISKEGLPMRDLIYTLNPSEFLEIPEEAFEILRRLLTLSPTDRITASEALRHPWLRGIEQGV